ncbi:Major Facilitator Superfamily [Geosmithia morbida]|uniref:Major Facilitator Superfamily n=1 Tax=Geosmithia morbida TaxID=1094350 RepID=A0A9P4YYA9_9HYPO|nr:Major Facilitator Superfamily [Geosmithia morbida]KAF4123913.1 Major Facilitator Superfamily [Geosmithia morbida]
MNPTSDPAVVPSTTNNHVTDSATTGKETSAADGGRRDNASTTSDDKDDDPQPPLPFSKARCIALVATVTGAALLNTLSLQSVVIILPTIGRDLDIPDSRQQWVVSSYALAFGCFLLVWGRIADIYGKRLIFIAGSFWVTVVSIANAFVPNEIAFDLFRGLHGLPDDDKKGAAANVPTAIGILGVTFPPGRAKNYAFSTYAAGAPLGSVLGNIVSGFIAQYANWKWVFGASAIMGGCIAAAGFFVIPSSPSPSPPPPETSPPTAAGREKKTASASVDWIGAVLVTVGLLLLLFSLTEGNVVGWSRPWIPVLIVVSVLILAVFVAWQHRLERRNAVDPTSRRPLVKVSMFRSARFAAVMAIMCLCFASFNNYLVFATYFFQDYQGLSPIQTMLRFIPTGVGGAVIAVIVSQLMHRVPTALILGTGNLAVSVCNLLYAAPIPGDANYFARGLPAMLLAVVGADTAWPSLTLFTSRALPSEDQAVGGALINAAGQLGRAIGLAISTAAQTAVMASGRGLPVEHAGGLRPWESTTLDGIRAASWVNFALGLVSLCLVPVAFPTLEIIGKPPPPAAAASTPPEMLTTAGDVEDGARHHPGHAKQVAK